MINELNKVETAVRLRHIPSGIIIECQQSRTQGENREKAIKMLKSQLYEKELQRQEEMKNKTNSTELPNIDFNKMIDEKNNTVKKIFADIKTQNWEELKKTIKLTDIDLNIKDISNTYLL